MKNCTLEKINNLVKALKNIGVKAEIKSDTVVIIVGKRKDGGSFYQPIRNTVKMRRGTKSGMIVSEIGKVNLFLRKFNAELGNNNQVIARLTQESSTC